MDTLFENQLINTQPLRKYEPLIRFDIDGNPQPRKPLQADPLRTDNTERPLKKDQDLDDKPTKAIFQTKESSTPRQAESELKRKVIEPPPSGVEPKKKQQKQSSIMSFFKKA